MIGTPDLKIINNTQDIEACKTFNTMTNRYDYDLSNCNIKCEFCIEKHDQLGNVDLSNSIFEDEVSLGRITISTYLDATDAIFNKGVDFSNSTFRCEITFNSSTFNAKANFSHCIFEEESTFEIIHLKEDATFLEAIFSKDVFFCGAKFDKDIEFDKTIFRGSVSFIETENNGQLDFIRTVFDKDVSFEDFPDNFEGRLSFINATFRNIVEFNDSYINEAMFLTCIFEDTASFYRTRFNTLDLKGSIFKVHGNFKDCSIKYAERESFRIIKHELKRVDNQIDALLFQKREMAAYWSELMENFSFKNKKSNRIQDIFIVAISWLSNNFGISYLRAFILYLFFTYLILIGISDYSFTWHWQFELFQAPEFWHFLNPTHKIDEISAIVNEKSPWVLGWNLFTRIVQGFLIYQFIRAFRKFSFK